MNTLRKIILDPLAWWISSNKLKSLLKSANDLETILQIPDIYTGRGFYDRIYAEQNYDEIKTLAELVSERQPKVIVEIGTYKGGTLFIWTRTNPQAELIVSIDLPGGQYGGGYDKRREKLYRLFKHNRLNTKMAFIRGDSHSENTYKQLKSVLKSRTIDFLYIDADHTYEGVKKDFNLYSSLVSKEGIIAFHDIKNMKSNHQVRYFWDEIKQNYPYLEILSKGTKTGNGILFF